MKSLLMLGAIVAATVGLAAPETAQAEHCYNGYSGYGGARYSSGYSYAPRSYGYSYSQPRYNSRSNYGGSHYGHGHSYGRNYGHYGGRGYGNSYGGFGVGIRTRGFSFSYRR
jgi:hypothetical protein